ncbi:MAG: TatD family nuclease-associated radical SAM protein [Firmicutes bacterium]|nr:TatD family nuclease-associated radical SAM protein [Bacillota bacterium]
MEDCNSPGQEPSIAYELHGALYLNITNRCSNDCVFCIRHKKGGVGYNLWLKREPSVPEILAAIGDPTRYREVVFCGYGEPLERPEVVIAVAEALKKQGVEVRLNTNGLADLILGYDILPQLRGLIDVISISLNSATPEGYVALTRSSFGTRSFPALLDFIRRSKLHIPKVILSVVRYPGLDLIEVQKIAKALDLELRVREYME